MAIVNPSPIRRILLGAPLHSGAAPHQRLSKIVALPVFSSDALSSVAYATQMSMIALIVAGSGGFRLTVAISGVIVLLLVILTISYNQTIQSYPNGGGAYIVARENLGTLAAEVAAVALLTDYILTVAVSVSSGIDAVLSAYTSLDKLPVRLALNVCATLFIMLINLRGVKESGAFFALPTYAFIVSFLGLIGAGIWQLHTGEFHHLALTPHKVYEATHPLVGVVGLWIILTAFANGCTALTGVEAISNGIPAFRPPESRNAATTMRWMAGILAVMFLGISYLAQHLAAIHHVVPSENGETVPSQIAHAVVGNSTYYYIVQWTTFLILVLAANTSFADFPRLSAIAARDRHLPRWLSVIGDRLVFQNGILLLAFLAILLELAFKGNTAALIPLYAIGVFVAFTLSQLGMVFRWRRLRSPGWTWRLAINGTGAVMTAVVALVFAVVKFNEGAKVVLIIMPAAVYLLTRIDHHYRFVARRLRLEEYREPPAARPNAALVLAPRVDPDVRAALEYARLISDTVFALHLRLGPEPSRVELEWDRIAPGVPLAIAENKHGGWPGALMDELYQLRAGDRSRIYTVVLPGRLACAENGSWEESASFRELSSPNSAFTRFRSWWVDLRIKWLLLNEPGVVLADASSLVLLEERDGAGNHPNRTPAGPASGSQSSLSVARQSAFRRDRSTVLLLVPGLHRGVVEAISYARQLGGEVRALHIEMEPGTSEALRAGWDRWAGEIPLIIMESPYRQLREPLLRYIDVTRRQQGTDILTVVVPEFVARKVWDKALHNQSGLLLKFAIHGQPNVVLANVRYFLDR